MHMAAPGGGMGWHGRYGHVIPLSRVFGQKESGAFGPLFFFLCAEIRPADAEITHGFAIIGADTGLSVKTTIGVVPWRMKLVSSAARGGPYPLS